MPRPAFGVRVAFHGSVMTTHIDRSGSQIDHLNVAVPDLAELLAFYQPTLAAIGITKILEVPADFETSQLEMHGFG